MILSWQQIPSPLVTEIISEWYDGTVLDAEHGCFNNETLYTCIQVLKLKKKSAFVRLKDISKSMIGMCLDAGADGLIFSTVETKEQCDSDRTAIDRHKNPQEEKAETVPIDTRHIIQFRGHARHKALEDPDGQRHREQTVCQCNGKRRIKKAYCRIELKKRQQKHRRRRHAIGQQPEEQLTITEEAIARKHIGCRHRNQNRN